MGELTSLCPDIVFSNFPSYAPHILISLSAAETHTKKYNAMLHLYVNSMSKPDNQVTLAYQLSINSSKI